MNYYYLLLVTITSGFRIDGAAAAGAGAGAKTPEVAMADAQANPFNARYQQAMAAINKCNVQLFNQQLFQQPRFPEEYLSNFFAHIISTLLAFDNFLKKFSGADKNQHKRCIDNLFLMLNNLIVHAPQLINGHTNYLVLAAQNSYYDLVKFFLERGMPADARDLRVVHMATPLLAACAQYRRVAHSVIPAEKLLAQEYLKIIRILLMHDADVNIRDGIQGMSFIQYANAMPQLYQLYQWYLQYKQYQRTLLRQYVPDDVLGIVHQYMEQ